VGLLRYRTYWLKSSDFARFKFIIIQQVKVGETHKLEKRGVLVTRKNRWGWPGRKMGEFREPRDRSNQFK